MHYIQDKHAFASMCLGHIMPPAILTATEPTLSSPTRWYGVHKHQICEERELPQHLYTTTVLQITSESKRTYH